LIFISFPLAIYRERGQHLRDIAILALAAVDRANGFA